MKDIEFKLNNVIFAALVKWGILTGLGWRPDDTLDVWEWSRCLFIIINFQLVIKNGNQVAFWFYILVWKGSNRPMGFFVDKCFISTRDLLSLTSN